MKSLFLSVISAMLVAVFFASPVLADHKLGHMHPSLQNSAAASSEKETVTDPVCGMDIKKSDAKFTKEYKGKKYYFCSEDCFRKFEADPGKYVKPQ